MCGYFLDIANNWSSIMNFILAVSSLVISYLVFQRDSGRFDVSVSLGKMTNGIDLNAGTEGLYIKIINSGRRPLLINSVGGEDRINRFRKLIYGIKEFKCFLPNGFILNGPEVTNEIMPNGRFRVLSEGEIISIFIANPSGEVIAKKIVESYPRFGVTDTLDRSYVCSRKDILKLKQALNQQV